MSIVAEPAIGRKDVVSSLKVHPEVLISLHSNSRTNSLTSVDQIVLANKSANLAASSPQEFNVVRAPFQRLVHHEHHTANRKGLQ